MWEKRKFEEWEWIEYGDKNTIEKKNKTKFSLLKTKKESIVSPKCCFENEFKKIISSVWNLLVKKWNLPGKKMKFASEKNGICQGINEIFQWKK